MFFLKGSDAFNRSLAKALLRMVVGPLVIAVVAGVEFAGRGSGAAVLAAYVSFVAAQSAVRLWGRWQVHRARMRLARARARLATLPRRR